SYRLAQWLRAHVHTFDVVHIHGVFSHACLAAASASRRANVPYIVRPLGNLAPWSMEQKAARKRLLLKAGVNHMLAGAAAIHCTSEEELRAVERMFKTQHGVVIPLGIDQEILDRPRATAPARDASPYILALSRVHPKKNLEALIHAFAAITKQTDR